MAAVRPLPVSPDKRQDGVDLRKSKDGVIVTLLMAVNGKEILCDVRI